MPVSTVYASSVAALDSHVYRGGGTDDTLALQAVLDRAKTEGGIHLVMDGAALVSHLEVYSNTTIECLNADCGFFQKDNSNCAIVTNANWNITERTVKNITLKGGTYNQNCAHQAHDVPVTEETRPFNSYGNIRGVVALEFYGVENVLLRDVVIVDFRTYAYMTANFLHMTLERVWLELPGRMQAQNQDGFHFWGPGQFLTIRDCGGRVGDDIMNIGPDEGDGVSSITDVLVDGLFLDDADQSIRILSRGTGLVDRVTIRNVQGTYRSFGFYINSWIPDVTAGNFGDIFIENVNLTHTAPNYQYRPPMLFSVGGNIRCLTLKNIRHEYPIDNRAIGEFGLPFYSTTPDTVADYVYPSGKKPVIQNLIIDGVTVLENEQSEGMEQLRVFGEVKNLVVKNVLSVKDRGVTRSGNLLKVYPCGHVSNAIIGDVFSVGAEKVIDGEENIDQLIQNNVISQ